MSEPAQISRPWLPYVVPMILFAAITMAEGELGNYVAVYIAKVIIVTGALIYFRSVWKEIKFEAKWLVPSIVIGVALFAAWVGIEKNFGYPHMTFLGDRTAFNPLTEADNAGMRAAFFAFRFFGLVLMVPLMEEIFWRSFLLRFITKPEFQTLKVGEFTNVALLIGTAFFGLAHPEWLPAVIFALAISLWLRYTKSLFAAIIVHLVTNLALGIYVVTQQDWIFW
ncbi:MAG: CAAX prenyl protease-related protein [Fimbriimonadales bacterium]